MSFHLTITVGSHFFKINKITSRARPTILEFAKRYIRYGLVKNGRGGFKREPQAVFAARTKDNEEFRFHINQLPDFKQLLSNHNLTTMTEWIELEVPEGTTVAMPVREGWKLRDYQEPIHTFILDDNTKTDPGISNKSKLVAIDPGRGKLQPMYSRIKVPGGWSTMGKMEVGTKVIAKDGSIATVVGVFPQGVKDIYRFKLIDGRRTDCGGEHLWKVYHNKPAQEVKTSVLTTLEVLELMKSGELVSIDTIDPEQSSDIQLSKTPSIAAKELLAESHDTQVVRQYLHASHNQRLQYLNALVPNLLDSTTVSVSLSSIYASDVVCYLARSLGYLASIIESKSSGRYIVTITRDIDKLTVVDITSVGRSETQCIAIDHPDKLYVTDDFIVTHNTSISMITASKMSKRFMVIIRPMYIDKWVHDVTNILDVRKDQVMVVQGGKQLQTLLMLAETDQLGDNVAIVMSNKTFQIWLKTYSKFGDMSKEMGYVFAPDEYYEKTGIGFRLNDEVHLDLHLQFLLDLYTNCQKSVGLSGSFVTNDSFLRDIQSLLYPASCRYYENTMNKYVTSTAVFYNIRNTKDVKTEYFGSSMYSHTAFEESIMNKPRLFGGYTSIVENMIDKFYMSDYKPGERCLVFCATKEMCGRFQATFQNKYSHLKVSRYVDDDPYENLMESDITFSTVLSAGTAHDVAMLKTAIMTISLESLASNIQAFGRLRDIPNLKTKFAYLVCLDIPKQVNYHRSKKELLLSRAKTYGEYFIPYAISAN